MKKENKINNVWTFNDNVFFKKSVDEFGQKIEHFDDIEYFLDTGFPESDGVHFFLKLILPRVGIHLSYVIPYAFPWNSC